MAITLTTLTAEVQTRCNALTNGSTAKEVIQAGIAAKKVEQAGGSITRTILDTQLTRIANASNSGSSFADLIALAASAEPSTEMAGYIAAIGSLQLMAGYNPASMPIEIVDEVGVKWLKTGVLATSSTYPALAAKAHLKHHEIVTQGTVSSSKRGWAISGNVHVFVSLGNVLSSTYPLVYSLDDGVTIVTKSTGLDADFTPMYIEYTGTHFLLIGAKASGANTFVAYVSVPLANVATASWSATVTSIQLGVTADFGNTSIIARAMGICKKGTDYLICCAANISDTTYNIWYGPITALASKGTSTLTGHNYSRPIGIDYLITLDRFIIYGKGESAFNLYNYTTNVTTPSTTSLWSLASPEFMDSWFEDILGRVIVKAVPWGSNSSITVNNTVLTTEIPVTGRPSFISGLGKYLGTDGTRAFFYYNGFIQYTTNWTTWEYRRVTLAGVSFSPSAPSLQTIQFITTNLEWKIANGYFYAFADGTNTLYKLNIANLISDTSNYCGTSAVAGVGNNTYYIKAS